MRFYYLLVGITLYRGLLALTFAYSISVSTECTPAIVSREESDAFFFFSSSFPDYERVIVKFRNCWRTFHWEVRRVLCNTRGTRSHAYRISGWAFTLRRRILLKYFIFRINRFEFLLRIRSNREVWTKNYLRISNLKSCVPVRSDLNAAEESS